MITETHGLCGCGQVVIVRTKVNAPAPDGRKTVCIHWRIRRNHVASRRRSFQAQQLDVGPEIHAEADRFGEFCVREERFWAVLVRAVEHLYVKVSDFWLPAHNHSVTNVLFGGHADLTIDYKDYQVTAASPLPLP